MHAKRLAVAVILLPLFYLAVMRLAETYFLGLLLIASTIALWEFYSMYRMAWLMKGPGIFFGILVLFLAYAYPYLLPHALMLSLMVLASLRLLGKKDPSSSLRDISPALLGVVYIPGLLTFQLSLRGIGPEWIIFLYGCVWASDSLAYYAGKTFGKRRLYQEVSPNKTVAGAWGSLAGGLLSGWVLDLALMHTMGMGTSMVVGIIIGFMTIIGDLVESMFKRDAGVKDSGSIIPGHGGVLDKIDGVLFAGPVFYWVSTAMGLIR
jgi:phosphatidate cytidylyltransferase